MDLRELGDLFAAGNFGLNDVTQEQANEMLFCNLADHAADLLQLVGKAVKGDPDDVADLAWRMSLHVRSAIELIRHTTIDESEAP
jgi:hypothetical protein